MRKPVILAVTFVFVFAMAGIMVSEANAAAACAAINSNGTVNGLGSFRVNTAAAETRRIGVGTYEVDFTPVGVDIRNFGRSAVLDTQTTGSSSGQIGLADRAGDTSSVFVTTYSSTGVAADRAFDLCIH